MEGSQEPEYYSKPPEEQQYTYQGTHAHHNSIDFGELDPQKYLAQFVA
jgi:hypothetical protein